MLMSAREELLNVTDIEYTYKSGIRLFDFDRESPTESLDHASPEASAFRHRSDQIHEEES
jgi:hypothetical protein